MNISQLSHYPQTSFNKTKIEIKENFKKFEIPSDESIHDVMEALYNPTTISHLQCSSPVQKHQAQNTLPSPY